MVTSISVFHNFMMSFCLPIFQSYFMIFIFYHKSLFFSIISRYAIRHDVSRVAVVAHAGVLGYWLHLNGDMYNGEVRRFQLTDSTVVAYHDD